MRRILALDPGSEQTGWVLFDGERVRESGVKSNAEMLEHVQKPWLPWPHPSDRPELAIEMMKARGMPTSNDEFRTLVWIGRFQQAWHDPEAVRLVYRQDVKLHVCGSMKAKDSNIRAALIDLVGPQGTKKAPGPTHGVSSHAWAALGVAVTALSQKGLPA